MLNYKLHKKFDLNWIKKWKNYAYHIIVNILRILEWINTEDKWFHNDFFRYFSYSVVAEENLVDYKDKIAVITKVPTD